MADVAVLVVHTVSALVLVGLIWTVQIVHYPLMAMVGADRFVAYESAHAPRMAALVMLPWTLQGLTTAWLLLARPAGVATSSIALAAVTAATTVAVTVASSIPAHARLGGGFDAVAHRRLVRSNWIRTWAWTVHGANAVTMLVRAG